MKAPQIHTLARAPRIAFLLIFCICAVFLGSIARVFSDSSLLVTARVGPQAIAPVITSVSPSGNPVVIARNSVQTFSLAVKTDPASSSLTYTVTPAVGMMIPEVGTIPVSGGIASIPVTFIAPSTKAGLSYFIVTVQDSTTHQVVNKRVNIYIY